MTRLGLGACLADDMGLGKTIQAIDLLLTLKRETAGDSGATAVSAVPTRSGRKESHRSVSHSTAHRTVAPDHGIVAPILLVVPASLGGNWKSEFERFAPSLNVLYAHRSECDAEQFQEVANDPIKSLVGYDAVVTTYGLVRRIDWFSKRPWRLVVLDEAQAIKNSASAQAKAVRKLNASGRIALSSTPPTLLMRCKQSTDFTTHLDHATSPPRIPTTC